jgi:release factor glutamine methyltransferase
MAEAISHLAMAGCIAPEEEVAELATAARGDGDVMKALVERRTTGEPLAWITGKTEFCGCSVEVSPGVFVPRWQSEQLAIRAAELLPPSGRAVDLGTGSGAIARVLMDRRPRASVIGTESDPIAAECARRNGVTVSEGDLFQKVPQAWKGTIDVVVAVLPYVPTGEIPFLARDVREFEPLSALDGGEDGLAVVRRVIAELPHWLAARGRALLEVGGDQPRILTPILEKARLEVVQVIFDEDGDARGIEVVATATN